MVFDGDCLHSLGCFRSREAAIEAAKKYANKMEAGTNEAAAQFLRLTNAARKAADPNNIDAPRLLGAR